LSNVAGVPLVPPLLEEGGREKVVLSRTRVTVLLVAPVVAVMALGIIGVLRAGSAAPNNNADDNRLDNEGRSTLTVVTKSRDAKVVDLDPQGPSQGDMRVVNAPLYNEGAKQKVGRLDLFTVLTDPADESNEKAHMAEVTSTYTLPDGEVNVQGVTTFPKISGPPPRSISAITGGTGKYAGVGGEVEVETRGNKVIITFHFID
jgi:hypothetical protein